MLPSPDGRPSGLSFSDAAGFHVVAPFEFERAFPFEQTHLDNARQISRLNRIVRQGGITVPKNDTYKDYARYAEHCLNMMTATTDQELRSIQREMAVEWLKLADTIRRPRRSKRMQMG
jgi:hypothetical protein